MWSARLLHRSVKYFLWSVFALAATLVAGTGLLAWRLSQGPLDLEIVKPYLEEALAAADSSYSVMIDSTVVAWGGWGDLLDLRARGVMLVDHRDRILATVPEASVSLSGRALTRRVLAPSAVRLIRPRLTLVRGADGAVRLDLGGGVPLAVEPGRSLPDLVESSLRLDALERVEVSGGSLEIRDEARGLTRRFSRIDAAFTRLPQGMVAQAAAVLPDLPTPARLRVHASYEPDRGRAAGRLTVDGLVPAQVADLLPEAAAPALAAAAVPVSGVVEAAWTRRDGLERLTFDLAGDAGTLTLPAPVARAHAIAAAHLRAAYDPAARRLTLEELYLDLDGPHATLRGLAQQEDNGDVFLRLDGEAGDFPVAALGDYWPETVGPKSRRWVLDNIVGGRVSEATVTLAGRLPAGAPLTAMRVQTLEGGIHPEGASVHYLRPLPPVEDAKASIVYDADSMRIHVENGRQGDLRLVGGEVHLKALSGDDPVADITLDLEGPLADALDLLDREPLGFASALGLPSQGVGGRASARLGLRVPLGRDVGLADVAVDAEARLREVVLPPVVADIAVADGSVTLAVDTTGMDVEGAVVLAGIPARLEWRENFGAAAAFRSRFRVRATLDDSQRRRLGLAAGPLAPPYVRGPVNVVARATVEEGGRTVVETDLDLAPAALALPQLDWAKPPGRPASAQVTTRFENERLAAVEHFVVGAGEGLDVQGRAGFADDGGTTVVFERLRQGRTDVAGEVVLFPDGGAAAALRGAAFDAAPLLDAPAEASSAREAGRPLRVSLAVERLWLSEAGGLDHVEARAAHDGDTWREGTLHARTRAGGVLGISLARGADGHVLRAESDDAGGVLAALDIVDDVRGGSLTLAVRKPPDGAATGEAVLREFQMVRAPLLARLLNLASVTGLVDELQGEGLRFRHLSMPFTYVDGVVAFEDARAWGMSLGLTADGRVNLRRERLAVQGTIVPMYLVNSVLGYVPFVGALLSPEKGGGLFAATYTMEGGLEDPDIRVNPLSTLAPGLLRRLFERDLEGLDGG